MVRTIIAAIYIGVWGVATIVILIRNGAIPPEYWTLPAVGLGGLLAALNTLDSKNKTNEDKPKKPKLPPPAEDSTAEENP